MNLTYSNVDIWVVIPFLFRDPTHKLGLQNTQQLQQVQQNIVPANNNNNNNNDNDINGDGSQGGGKRKRIKCADSTSMSALTMDCNAKVNTLVNSQIGQNKAQNNAQNNVQNNGEIGENNEQNNGENAVISPPTDPDGWKVWDFFRHVSGSDKRVHIALEFKSFKVQEGVTAGIQQLLLIEQLVHVVIGYIIANIE